MPSPRGRGWLGSAFDIVSARLSSSPRDYQPLYSTNGAGRNSDDFALDDFGDDGHSPPPDRSPYRQHETRRRSSYFICAANVKRAILHRLTLRRFLCYLVFGLLVLSLGVLLSGIPPTYEDLRTYERLLPQHNLTRAKEGGHKYLKFRGQLWGHGLNNILQETVLMSYLSYLTNRSFVFDDYVWSHSPFPYTIYGFALRPARMPFSAFISGPTAGGPTSFTDPETNRIAVNAEFYNSICPPPQVHVLPSNGAPHDVDGASYIKWWVDRLSSIEGVTCVEIDADEHQVFDLWLFGEKRILTLWDDLSRSPILRNFSWSHLVLSAVLRNWVIIRPPSRQLLYDNLFTPPKNPPIPVSPESHKTVTYTSPGLPGLLAIHIRRGDFSRHCKRRAKYNSSYMGLNQFPSFIDVFDPEPYHNISSNHNSKSGDDNRRGLKPQTRSIENEDPRIVDAESYYMAHCFPSIPQIVSRLDKVRNDHPGLKRVYVLSNAWESWLRELKGELMKQSHASFGMGKEGSRELRGWEDVITGHDLVLDSEQRYIDIAVDMAIAEQAEVFVGNGFSSASSNIVMLRMAKGMDPKANRFL